MFRYRSLLAYKFACHINFAFTINISKYNYSSEGAISDNAKLELSKLLITIKEECRGQGLDLADMADAIKTATQSFHFELKKADITEAKIEGKILTLNNSLKAYTTRLANLENESRCIQTEAESLNKLITSNILKYDEAKFSDPPLQQQRAIINENNGIANSTNKSKSKSKSDTGTFDRHSNIEKEETESNFTVEKPRLAEVLECGSAPNSPLPHKTVNKESLHEELRLEECNEKKLSEEIQIDEIEIEPPCGEEEKMKESYEQPNNDISAALPLNDITRELYEHGVDFTDCRDEVALRQRYIDEIIAKSKESNNNNNNNNNIEYNNKKTNTIEHKSYANNTSTTSLFGNHLDAEKTVYQPTMPNKPAKTNYQYQNNQTRSSSSPPPPPPPPPHSQNVSAGLVSDPYPNAERKMYDASKYIWQLKQEIAVEKNVSADIIELWCNKVCLADPMRLCDYPITQSFPIEVHQKGYIPY